MNTRLKLFAAGAVLAITAGPFLTAAYAAPRAPASSAMPVNDQALASTVKDALEKALGSDAKDLSVVADHGVVMLNGWVNLPRQEAQARTVASAVPGVVRAYSHVHTWSSSDEY
jgi:osmotically-inducible protein OsmY